MFHYTYVGRPHKQLRSLRTKLLLTLASVCLSSFTHANSNTWQCTVSDQTAKEWQAKGKYKKIAVHKALDRCKKESTVPASCKSNCESLVNGVSTRPLWRCTALDRMGKPWVSNLNPHRLDAALAAKAYCQENSSLPETCYTNTVTCKNIQESY